MFIGGMIKGWMKHHYPKFRNKTNK